MLNVPDRASNGSAGVAFPGDLLAELVLAPDEEALKTFRSAYPVRISSDENGVLLPTLDEIPGGAVLAIDDESELEILDD